MCRTATQVSPIVYYKLLPKLCGGRPVIAATGVRPGRNKRPLRYLIDLTPISLIIVTMPWRAVGLCFLVAFLAACGRAGITANVGAPTRPAAIARSPATPTLTPTPILSPTPSDTPTPSATPTMTPTPTPTAPPLAIVGDPRAGRLSDPIPTGNAPCGVVDVLDFPVDPPDAASVPAGGGDFGVYRGRFGKYHAGEDWWVGGRGASFGKPVYSIGHGLVTYAEPLGWNRDKGVIIIQHTFADGSTLLSFYGHLDPPSIVLQPGQCVVRGEQIAQIGRPRSSPHLHFEIRTQSPYAPLTGYWPEDPALVGWLPPSQTIWQQRIAGASGVQWTRPFAAEGTKGAGIFNGDTLVAVEDAQLIGLDLAGGSVRWQYADSGRVSEAALDALSPVVYVAGRAGWVEALRLPGDDGAGLSSHWRVELDLFGTPTLIPLPQGGVLLAIREKLFALAPDGSIRWQSESLGQPLAWAAAGEELILSTTGGDSPLWQIGQAGPEAWDAPAGGYPVVAGEQWWLYAGDGLYRLDAATRTAGLVYAFPRGMLALGDAVALPDGGLLVAHADAFDRRLVAFNADGSLRWERSYAGLLAGAQRLLVVEGAVYLVSHNDGGQVGEVSVYAVDVANAELRHIFVGGTRTSVPADTWALVAGQGLVINIGGGHMLALDPQPPGG